MTRKELLKIAKPILFNTDMVRAILDERKTATRRVLKQPFEIYPNGYITKPMGNERLCPYEPPYLTGDILYVRETWRWLPCFDCNRDAWEHAPCKESVFNIKYRNYGCYVYKADIHSGMQDMFKWHPSIHMPKEVARIFLKVKDVRVERLQDIDDKGAYEEGAGEKDAIYYIGGRVCDFAKIWNSTIKNSDLGKYGWDANPYVWVIEFEKLEVDQ